MLQGISCSFGYPNCGTHGTLTAPCSCTCATGYTTAAQQDLASYKYCTIQTGTTAPGTYLIGQNSSGGNWCCHIEESVCCSALGAAA